MDLLSKLTLWLYRDELNSPNIDDYQEDPTPVGVVRRFKLLFKLHGVQESEIPELYPEISLYVLQSDERLLEKLTPDFLKELAEFFQIRIEWLRSGEPYLFDTRDWYKQQTLNFFEDLKAANFQVDHEPFEIISTKEKFDIEADEHQPFILAIRVAIASIDDRVIYRYMLGSEWRWHHEPCRVGAKAIASAYYQLTRRMIPIYTISKDDFKRLSSGIITPNVSRKLNHKISFEEYGAVKLPHMEPYESHEYERVIKEMEDRGLSQFSYDYLSPEVDRDEEGEVESHYRKAALAKHAKTYQLKRDCILFWLTLQQPKSDKEAARLFIKSLPEDKAKILTPTNGVDTLAGAISEYRNKDKIFNKKGHLPLWMEGFNPS